MSSSRSITALAPSEILVVALSTQIMTMHVCVTLYFFPRLPYSQGLGKPGYYLFNFTLLLIFYGVCIGTMIVMTDFMESLPILSSWSSAKRYIMQILLTIMAILLCLLKDPGVLVRISSFGLLALIVSFVLLFIYCFACGSFRWQPAYLAPLSFKAFLNNFGVFVYSLGITPLLFTQLVGSVPRVKRRGRCSARSAGKPPRPSPSPSPSSRGSTSSWGLLCFSCWMEPRAACRGTCCCRCRRDMCSASSFRF